MGFNEMNAALKLKAEKDWSESRMEHNNASADSAETS